MTFDLHSALRDQNRRSNRWSCAVFDLSRAEHRQELVARLERHEIVDVYDTMAEQLRDLVAARKPSRELDERERSELVTGLLGATSLADYGRWVHFPWSRRLVHLLAETEFRQLRADRNRNKITTAEQGVLRGKRVGIVGLSVGHSAATTMALEGVGGQLRLADFDTLSLSNLNRLRQGVHQLGDNKAVLAARDLAEIDPYLEVEIFPDGVTDDNLDRFLVGAGKLDLLVEECDDLYVKTRLRERARALGIPVIMDTSDRGLLDIERYDREPQRPLFHGLVPDLRAESLRALTTKEKIPFVMAILGGAAISPALAASLGEVRKSISTWPQLGSGVTLGGALVTDAARRILLGSMLESGRFYVDLDALVCDQR